LEKGIKVLVQFLGRFTAGGGSVTKEMEVPAGAAVSKVVDLFEQKYGGTIAGPAEVSPAQNIEAGYMVMLNGRSLEKDKQFTATVRNGDRITIFFPIGGG